MRTINHPWKNKCASLEKKLDVVNTALYNSNMDLKSAKNVIETKKEEISQAKYANEVLKSKYGLVKSLAKLTSVATLVLGLTTTYLSVKSSNDPKTYGKITSNIKKQNSAIAPEFQYLWDTPTSRNTTAYYPIFKDDNALDMHAYAQSGSKIYELAAGSGNLDEKGFLIPEELRCVDSSFKIWAIDRNGNESKKTTLYAFKGYVSEKPIQR